jgi:hypothetical protein
MLVRNLIPLVVLGAVGVHGVGAVKERVRGAVGAKEKLITKQHMAQVLAAVELRSATGEEISFKTDADVQRFIRSAVRVQGSSQDLSKDEWGTPYHGKTTGNGLTLLSAGPDRAFGTADDVTATQKLYDY